MECYLGIDAGGTKCEALLVSADGQVRGWGSQRTPGISGRSRASIIGAVQQTLATLHGRDLVIHAAIIGGEDFDTLQPSPAASFGRVVTTAGAMSELIARTGISRLESVMGSSETDSALALHGQSWGVVALAGTGAFVHVRSADGRSRHLDGMGPVLGDHGGAYQIGLRAFREAARAHWHPRRATELRARVFAALRLDGVTEAVRFSLNSHDRSVFAALAAEVDAAARNGDAIARRILEDAADELAATVRDAVESTGTAEADCALIGIGSVATRSAVFWDRLCHSVRGFAPHLRPLADTRPPAIGVLAHCLGRRAKLDTAEVGRLSLTISASLAAFLQPPSGPRPAAAEPTTPRTAHVPESLPASRSEPVYAS